MENQEKKQVERVLWEYYPLVVNEDENGSFNFNLTQWGAEGWELVQILDKSEGGVLIFFFKRPKF